MNYLSAVPTPQDEDADDERALVEQTAGWQMKKLTQRHRQIASLLAQGLDRRTISKMIGVTPEYVTMLTKQPLMKQYINEMCEHVGVRFEALFEKAVDVIAETMTNGTEAGKLKAARLQLEGTKRIGRPDLAPKDVGVVTDRLEQLAQRLLYLQSGKHPPGVYSENGEQISEAEFREVTQPEVGQAVSEGQDN